MEKKKIRIITPHASLPGEMPEEFEYDPGCGYDLSVVKLETGPVSIESMFDEILANPGIVARAIEAEREGVDAIVIDCMGDPGLYACREAVTIPVLGPGESSMHIAAMLGHRFSIVTIMDRVRPIIEGRAKNYGVYDKLASVRAVDVPVLEIEAQYEQLVNKLTEESTIAVQQDKADLIVLGCTGFLGCAEAIERALAQMGIPAPVIDPMPATIAMAGALIETGLSHSSLCYPGIPDKPQVGYSLKPVAKP